MSTLFSRLSLVFAGILLCLGIVAMIIGHRSQQRYFEEFTQELNRPIAMYMANQTRLFVGGQPDKQALVELASHVMMINPSLDVYLLDPLGRIVAAAPSNNAVIDQMVDLEPLLRFLSGQDHFPLFGDNPLVPDQKHVFSVYPVSETEARNNGCKPCGYVYVVLGGASHRSLWQSLSSSYTLQAGATMFAGVLVFALFAGIAVFFMMTRPLRAMTRSLGEWRLSVAKDEVGDDVRSPVLKASMGQSLNELQALEQTCMSMAKRLEQQFMALDSADQRRRAFLTNVSHDLRTPLTSLSGAIETLLVKSEQISQADHLRYLQLAQRQANRLRCLISQVFEMARLDSGDVKLQFERLSLSDLVFDTVQDLASEAAAKGVDLTVSDTSKSANVSVLADMGMIQSVLENLVFNAVRHTQQGGFVRVNIQQGGDQAGVVEIVDSGGGFCRPMEALPLLDYIELDDVRENMRSGNAESSGLGLRIVQRILALHGSQALIWSQPGEGTRIQFSLPSSHDWLASTGSS